MPKLVTGIPTIGEDVPHPGAAADDLGEHERCAAAILDVGVVDHGMNQIAIGVGQDVALAAFDLLARNATLRPAALGGFDTLAIDNPDARGDLATHRFPPDQQQGAIE